MHNNYLRKCFSFLTGLMKLKYLQTPGEKHQNTSTSTICESGRAHDALWVVKNV
jgi:hypothetical protein